MFSIEAEGLGFIEAAPDCIGSPSRLGPSPNVRLRLQILQK